jgi:hypothetical protein
VLAVQRIVTLAVLLLLVGSTTGLFSIVEEACTEDCGDDDAGGACCPSTCLSCVCAGRSIPVVAPHASIPSGEVAAVVGAALAASDDTPPDPDPHEILHVPRRSA